MNTIEMCTQHNEEVRYKYMRLQKAVQFLVELKIHYSPEHADKFVNEFGREMLCWMKELLDYWSKDKDMQYCTESVFKTKEDSQPAQEVSLLDMMRTGASYGMMSAWDMSRAAGKPWWRTE